jgi:DNA-directed RNA polymerase subunit RPC12/RpoP
MLWHVRHSCPQCGAPVDLSEAERLLTCPFCRVRLFMVPSGMFRYVIPPRNPQAREVIYIPYWRLKGTLFSVGKAAIAHRIMDATSRALESPELPFSLGIRPQAMHLTFAQTASEGIFLRPSVPVASAVDKMVTRLSLAAGEDRRGGCRTYVGEQRSIIYAPYYVRDGRLYDAVLERALPNVRVDALQELKRDDPSRWDVRYLPVLCPECGWDLSGAERGLVFPCSGCGSGWRHGPGRPVKIFLESVPAKGEGIFLPFWRIRAEGRGHEYRTYADLVRWANLPKVIQPQWEEEPAWFLVPAFKLRPDLFLRLSGQMTVAQPGNCVQGAAGKLHPATLSLEEAEKSLKIVHAALASRKTHVLPTIAVREFTTLERRLTYLPFREQGQEFVHDELGISLSRSALEHGNFL